MLWGTLPFALLAVFGSIVYSSPISSTRSITWANCKQNASIPISCGTLEVPKDYTNKNSDETITLWLVKVPAVKQPSKGSIIINTGGPGLAQRDDLAGDGGRAYQVLTGGVYDLVTFDPRGTGETLPFTCYNTTAEGSAALAALPRSLTSSDTALGEIWAQRQIFAERCRLQASDYGDLIGTAFTARDVMQIVDALGEDGMLRYLGFSYGTALGATLAAMFPQRMDKVVLDGVLNMEEYYAGEEVQQLADSDSTWAGFFKGCMEAPDLCPFASQAKTAEELQCKFDELLKTVKYAPIPLGPIAPYDLIDYNALKSLILSGIYYPTYWPSLSTAFDAVFTGNSTLWDLEYLSVNGAFGGGGIYPQYQGPEALQGIRCSDTALRTDNLTDLEPILSEFLETSSVLGDVEPTAILMPCAAWKMQAKERYTMGWKNLKTKNPILFVGSPHDPFTPLPSARNVSAAFEGSVVLEHLGYGHCSISQPSLCTARYVRDYFLEGTLPKAGTACKPSVPIFRDPNLDLLTVLSPLNSTSKRSVDEDNDDSSLLAALSHISRRMSKGTV